MDKYSKPLKRVDEVAAWRLCMGCGACKWACPHGAVDLVNLLEIGLRPVIDESKCQECGQCVDICPGIHLEHKAPLEIVKNDLFSGWGPIIAMYKAYAVQSEVRFRASSGGVATALALYGIEKAGMAGVLHIRSDPGDPLRCIPTFSRTREEVLSAIGSRYAPAAPCQAFDLIKQADGPCLFIGKPCDVAALRKAQKMDTDLDARVGLAVSIFCAGTPAESGTKEILQAMNIAEEAKVQSFRYRGYGWPGEATAQLSDGGERGLSYEESWGGILSNHVSLRCRLCPDGTGEFADISCGDMWVDREHDKVGLSNILVRTVRGMQFWQGEDVRAYVTFETCDDRKLALSQPSLLRKKRQLWGRMLAMTTLRLPVPLYNGFCLRDEWRSLQILEKLRTLLGTLKRAIKRKWYRREKTFRRRHSNDH